MHYCEYLPYFPENVSSDDIIEYLNVCLKMDSIDHSNVLKVIAVTFDELGHISIVYPYLEEHDLLTWLKKKRGNVLRETPSKVSKLHSLVVLRLLQITPAQLTLYRAIQNKLYFRLQIF